MVKRRETYSGLRGEFFSPVWTTKGMASSRGRQDDVEIGFEVLDLPRRNANPKVVTLMSGLNPKATSDYMQRRCMRCLKNV